MEWKNKGVFFSVWGLLFVLLVGCATVPKNPENPYLGFVYNLSIKGDANFKQDGVESALKRYREQIASEVLQRRRNKYDFHDRSLDKTREYIANLERPVLVEEDRWKRAIDDSLSKKEKKTLLAYWEANKPLGFDGSESLDDWESSLASAKLQFDTDTRIAKKLESDIEALRKENNFRDALAKVDKLQPYMSKRASELRESLKKDASDYWVGVRMLEIDGLRSAKTYDDDHEQQVLGLYAKICDDVKAFGNRENFNGVFTAWQDLLGENWRKRIVEMGERKAYWEAYEFARIKYEGFVVADRFGESYRDGLKLEIGKGYFYILDNAIRHYSDLASNACKLKGLDGKAYVYCCMAKEMYDFVTFAGLGYNERTETWYERISELEKNELIPPLGSRVARRLVIHDFKRGDPDILGLAEKFRQSCREEYALGNNHAWGLEVVSDKVSLAQLEAGSLQADPDDYVIEWSRAVFDVNRSYGTPETKSKTVKTDRIRLIENPFRKDKSSPFHKLKLVQAQEVDLYSLTETVNGAKIICDMEVICRHHGENKAFKMPVTNRRYEEVNEKLGSVATVKAALFLASAKMEYYLPDTHNNEIPRDGIPSDSVVNIPNQDWFEEEFTGYILTDLENGLESLIDMYPVDLLVDTDRDASSEYLDTLGTVLFYVANLSSTDAVKRESAGKGYEWLHLRDQIADDTKKWCGEGERWSAAGADEKKILSSLWEECVKVGNEQDGR